MMRTERYTSRFVFVVRTVCDSEKGDVRSLWYKPSVSKKRITEPPKVMDQKIFRRIKSWYTSSTATGSRDDHLVPPEYKLPTYYVVFIYNQQMLSSFILLRLSATFSSYTKRGYFGYLKKDV